MQKHKKYKLKTVGLLTLLCYFTTHVLYADQGMFQKGPSIHSDVMISSQITKNIIRDIPYDLGQIHSHFEGKKSSLIVHIQDAHANPVAQRNVAKIIDHFVVNHGVEWIGVEGASGELWSDPLAYATDDVRRIVADYYLDQGRLTGAEYYRVAMSDQVQLFGIEDSNLYYEHHKIYTEYLSKKEKYSEYYKKLKERLNAVVEIYINSELKEWIQLQDDLSSHRISLVAYLQRAFEFAQKAEIDISLLPHLSFLKINLNLEDSSAEVPVSLSENVSSILQ